MVGVGLGLGGADRSQGRGWIGLVQCRSRCFTRSSVLRGTALAGSDENGRDTGDVAGLPKVLTLARERWAAATLAATLPAPVQADFERADDAPTLF